MGEDMEDEMMDLDAEDSYDSESPDEIPAKVTRLPEKKKENIVAKVSKQVVPDSDSEDEDDKLAASDSDESDSEDEADLAAIMA
jgi:hypothetical protein